VETIEYQVNDQVDIQVWEQVRLPVHDRSNFRVNQDWLKENLNENRK